MCLYAQLDLVIVQLDLTTPLIITMLRITIYAIEAQRKKNLGDAVDISTAW